ncbi:hypothetical protein NDU88_004649 [Pleurodeles waltl]|uniref:Uncharacterized protein n=1 Tax=Pleurodeles waltl TaxID=8319 RepID=A0AAV7L0H5_PLEWA|nr:hypothetical protein NDU88_004649 [Pleurodeles waltl]
MRRKDPREPRVLMWKDTLTKWAEAEGKALRLELAKGTGSEEGTQQWDTLLDRLKYRTKGLQEQNIALKGTDPEVNDNTSFHSE